MHNKYLKFYKGILMALDSPTTHLSLLDPGIKDMCNYTHSEFINRLIFS